LWTILTLTLTLTLTIVLVILALIFLVVQYHCNVGLLICNVSGHLTKITVGAAVYS